MQARPVEKRQEESEELKKSEVEDAELDESMYFFCDNSESKRAIRVSPEYLKTLSKNKRDRNPYVVIDGQYHRVTNKPEGFTKKFYDSYGEPLTLKDYTTLNQQTFGGVNYIAWYEKNGTTQLAFTRFTHCNLKKRRKENINKTLAADETYSFYIQPVYDKNTIYYLTYLTNGTEHHQILAFDKQTPVPPCFDAKKILQDIQEKRQEYLASLKNGYSEVVSISSDSDDEPNLTMQADEAKVQESKRQNFCLHFSAHDHLWGQHRENFFASSGQTASFEEVRQLRSKVVEEITSLKEKAIMK